MKAYFRLCLKLTKTVWLISSVILLATKYIAKLNPPAIIADELCFPHLIAVYIYFTDGYYQAYPHPKDGAPLQLMGHLLAIELNIVS